MDEAKSFSHSKWKRNSTWFLFQNAGVGPCTGNCDAISERFSTRWLDNARAGIEEGHLMPDHVHMLISIPPEYAVSQVVGYIKGKSAIHVARVYGERKRNFVGRHVWCEGVFCLDGRSR